mmetsp:Transcript_118224/g.329719  ORF Transcript_118224/g.329719 Transcript_118224/m.329719 type:complete len:207 (+) Transcript_118224:1171-1791(+)
MRPGPHGPLPQHHAAASGVKFTGDLLPCGHCLLTSPVHSGRRVPPSAPCDIQLTMPETPAAPQRRAQAPQAVLACRHLQDLPRLARSTTEGLARKLSVTVDRQLALCLTGGEAFHKAGGRRGRTEGVVRGPFLEGADREGALALDVLQAVLQRNVPPARRLCGNSLCSSLCKRLIIQSFALKSARCWRLRLLRCRRLPGHLQQWAA